MVRSDRSAALGNAQAQNSACQAKKFRRPSLPSGSTGGECPRLQGQGHKNPAVASAGPVVSCHVAACHTPAVRRRSANCVCTSRKRRHHAAPFAPDLLQPLGPTTGPPTGVAQGRRHAVPRAEPMSCERGQMFEPGTVAFKATGRNAGDAFGGIDLRAGAAWNCRTAWPQTCRLTGTFRSRGRPRKSPVSSAAASAQLGSGGCSRKPASVAEEC